MSVQRSFILFNFLLQRCSCAFVHVGSKSKRPQEATRSCRLADEKSSFIHTWPYTRIADENENRSYRTNQYDNTQNRFEYRRKRSMGTSSALVRNETHLVLNEMHLARDGGNLPLSGTVC